jgi:hypothetical protein
MMMGMRNKILLFVLMLIFFSSIALAQKITLGIQPSEITLDFYKSDTYNVEFLLFNEYGDIDAIYTIKPDECLQNVIKNYPQEITVPKGTKRLENPVSIWIQFTRDNKGNKTCNMILSGRGVGVNETSVKTLIKPAIAVKVIIIQGFSEQDYTSQVSSGSSGISIIKLPARQTTTTTTSWVQIQPTQNNLQEEVKTETREEKTEGKFNWTSIIIPLAVIGVIGVAVFYLFYKKPVILLTLVLFLALVSSVSAIDTNIPVSVNVTIAPPPPPPRPPEVVMMGLLPFIASGGLLLFAFHTIVMSPKDVKDWIGVGVSILIYIVMILVLTSVI